MTWEDLLTYFLAKPGAGQDEPWDGDVVVKVGAKIFASFGSGTSVGVSAALPARRRMNGCRVTWMTRR